jgi:hypothetical protein
MANKTYDPGANQENAKFTRPNNVSNNSAGRINGKIASDSTDHYEPATDRLRQAEHNNIASTGSGSASPPRSKQTSRIPATDLRAAENSGPSREGLREANKIPGSDLRGVPSHELGPEASRIPFRNDPRNFGNYKSRFVSKIKRHKLLVGAGVGAGVLLAGFILLLILLIGAYKLVDFAEHVAAYQFARTTAQMAEDTTQIDGEKFGLDSLLTKYGGDQGQALYDYLSSQYSSATGGVKNLWSKLDNYRPSKIIDNFDDKGTLQINTGTTAFGNTYAKSITLDGKTLDLEPESLSQALKYKFIPGYKFFSRDLSLANEVQPYLTQALKANDIGPITRAQVASEIRQQLDVNLVAWNIAKFQGKDQNAADAEEQQLSFDFGEGSAQPSGPYASQAEKLNQTEAADAQDPATSINPNQLSLDLGKSLEQSIPSTAFSSFQSFISTILKFINPIYAIATPVCLIYDGSIQSSQGSIDYQSQQAERDGILVQTEAAQEKDGSAVSGEAVGAATWKLGNISDSNAELRANGEPANTSSFGSTESSASGQYSYSLADYLPGPLASITSSIAGTACPAVTNLWLAGGITIASLLTLPEVDAEDSLISKATDAINAFIPKSTAELGEKIASAKGIAGSMFKNFVGITAATLLARQIVASEAGVNHNSLDTGQSYDNTVDAGTNIYANQINQQQFYGAPMTDQNLAQTNAQAQSQLARANSQQSMYQRYFALDNANSLFSNLLMSVSGYLNNSFFSSLLHVGSALLDPIRTIGSVISPLLSGSSLAASTVTSNNTFYGNVQFGYTSAEQSLIQNNSSYQPLENQQILDESGQEANIAARYGVCFDGSESIGTMLANGDIQRNSKGNVIANQGLCSPDNLGPNNQDTGCNTTGSSSRGCDYTGCPGNQCGPGGKGFGDLVFRWRVAKGYDNVLNQLISEQTVTATTSTSGGPPSSPSGYENPFRGVTNLGTSRVDQGVDFTGSGPVYAIGNGKVLSLTNSGWPGGTFIVYQLSNGPATGKYVYMAENCQDIQVHIGEEVTPGTVLCTMVNASPHIETGWADGSAIGDSLAKPVFQTLPTGAAYATAYGQNFRELLTSLGVTVPSCYDIPGAPLSGEPLPSSWPTWTSNPATKSGSLSCPPGE